MVVNDATMKPAISSVTPTFDSSERTAIRMMYVATSGLYGPPVK
jgi:hypothetical protein